VGVLGPVQLVAAVGDYDYDDEIVKDLSKKKNGVIKLDSTGIMTCITTMRTALKHGIQMVFQRKEYLFGTRKNFKLLLYVIQINLHQQFLRSN